MKKAARTKKKIEYRPSLVCFIDVLGFQALLKKRSAHDVHEILSTFGSNTKPEKKPAGVSNKDISLPQWFQVSDAVVRVRHFDTKFRDGALFNEVFDLGIAQANLAMDGVFIRGGLAIGEASTGKRGKGPAFGPAFVKAYELESQLAIYPRISVSHSVIDEYRRNRNLKAETHDSDKDEEYVLPMIRGSATGPWIDYMAIVQQNEAPDEHVDFCSRHAEKIRACLAEFGDNPSVMAKYLWLASYHNQHVEFFASDPTGEKSASWLDQFEFDGVAVYRASKIIPPYGWSLPDKL